MAVYSMTGFANVTATPSAHAQDSTSSRAGVTVELRSVNGRFLDLSLRLPDELRSLEPALRETIASAVRRGKIELRVVTHRESESGWPMPAPEQLSRLARLESTVQTWLPGARALSEAAAFALRIDVAEELTRLNAHLDEIERLLNTGGEVGKRLDFLIQELNREANTLGSKSATLELTNIAVDMKVLVEQLREQVQNLE